MSFVDEEDQCPEERVKNIVVELKKIADSETEETPVQTKKMLNSCQFIFTKLEKAPYQIKLIEKQGKALTKVISEKVLDLSEDKDINDGVKVYNVNIQKSKSSLQENLNYSIFSPSIIAILLLAMFQWNNTLWLLEKVVSKFRR